MKEMKQMTLIESIIQINKAASKDSVRYSLNGVRVIPVDSGVKLQACDGHILSERDSSEQIEGLDRPVIISSDSIKTLKSFFAANKKAKFSFKLDGRFVVASTVGQSLSLETIDAEYPDVERAKPKFDTYFKVSFNPALLFELCESLRGGKADKVATLEFSNDKLTPIKVKFSGNSGVLMPCREG